MAPLLKSQAGPGTGGFPPSLPVMEATGPWRVWDASPRIRAEPQAREGPGSPAPRRCQKHLRLKKPKGLLAERSNQLPFGVMRPLLKTEWSLWDWPSTSRLFTPSQTLGLRGCSVQRLRVWLKSTPYP